MAEKDSVVVTGIGLVTALGFGVKSNWERLCHLQTGFKPWDKGVGLIRPCLVGQVPSFEGVETIRGRSYTFDRTVQLAYIAAKEAMDISGLRQVGQAKIGVVVGTGFGCIQTKENHYLRLGEDPCFCVHPLAVLEGMDNAAASELAFQFGLRGPNQTVMTACSSGLNAIGNAMLLIRQGVADGMLVGGVDAAISTNILRGWQKMHILSLDMDPIRASRPFDKTRKGFVLSEGSGFLVLESESIAKKRGASILAKLTGFSSNCDAAHPTSSDAKNQARCISDALSEATCSPEMISYINAHGTGTQANDCQESQALRISLGSLVKSIPMSATKSQLGHSMGACGAIEAVVTIKMMMESTLLPTPSLNDPDPACDLNYVLRACKTLTVERALKVSFGFGGSNAALVIEKP